jgi:hypothetical protein
MCVTCLGNNQHTHSNHTCSSALLHNLNKKYYTHINTPFQYGNHNQTGQTIEKCLFNNLDFLRYSDRIDMTKEL